MKPMFFLTPFNKKLIKISQSEMMACNLYTTFNSGCLGSHIDEERCELRYVMRIAEFSESSKFWTHIALPGYAWEYACISVRKSNLPFFFCVVSDWNGRMWSVLKVWLLLDHQVLLNWHCLSILLLWSVTHERGDLLIACMCWRLRWEHIEETTICGMFGFGSTILLIVCGICFCLEVY